MHADILTGFLLQAAELTLRAFGPGAGVKSEGSGVKSESSFFGKAFTGGSRFSLQRPANIFSAVRSPP